MSRLRQPKFPKKVLQGGLDFSIGNLGIQSLRCSDNHMSQWLRLRIVPPLSSSQLFFSFKSKDVFVRTHRHHRNNLQDVIGKSIHNSL